MQPAILDIDSQPLKSGGVNRVPDGGPSVNRRIFRAAVIVTLAGILVKLVATFKEFAIADIFGRSDAMDAFLIAFLIPGLLVNLFSESMNQALVPTLVKVREFDGHPRAQELLSSAMLWTCMLLTGGSLVMAAAAHFFFPLLAAHFPAAKLLLTEELFYGLLPVVVIAGIASNCSAVLNTFDRFAWPALAPMATPLAVVIGAWLLVPRFGIWSLVYGNVVGALIHAVIMVWMMHAHGYRFALRWHGFNPAIREVAGQYGPILLSGLVASSGLLVDQGMAATLPSGSVSTLVYANRFVSVVVNLLAGAVATAVTPYFSQMVARREWAACRHTLNTYVRLTALISVPVAMTMIFGSHLLIRLTFQHGAFGPQDTAAVAPVQAMYAIQLPFFIVSRVFYRYLVAIRRTSLILYCGMINLVLDVILNIVCMRWMGVAGIALATSLWTISTFAFLCYWAYRLLPPPEKLDAA
ncbi:murein biosynthesis integral membrane protein MurJ [Acidicapsa ligni]|uniref:murein biosynthesis integral membrane protein MurJ n=1 Tax=Acidicapsa ligni TaxID=542300 RepID=UPI0021DFB606|nr:murein biosynthesis integral membrane protein MurJ [Acidicapsa ligni]